MDTTLTNKDKRPLLRVNTKVLSTLAWWHWLATAALIALHYGVWPGAIVFARVMCAAMLLLRIYSDRRPTRGVQVYGGFLMLLFIGELPYMGWYYYTMLAGTLLNCTIGYCPLDRILLTLPFNNAKPSLLLALRDAAVGNLLVGGLIQRNSASTRHPSASPACMQPTSI